MKQFFLKMTNITTTWLSDKSFIISGTLPDNVCPNFKSMMLLKPQEVDTVIIFGKQIPTPRFVAHYEKAYNYTGRLHEAQPTPDIIRPLLDWCNENVENGLFTNGESCSTRFNQVLVNYYLNGLHYIGKHSDDERQISPNSVIFSASFGETRTFRIRKKKTNEIIKDIQMSDRSYIIMGGDMQKEYTHEVPKIIGAKGLKIKPRINITFRMFK